MNCMICKHGKTTLGTATITLEKNGATVVFQKVPAQVCDNCGEEYIDSKITSEVLKKAQDIISRGAHIDVRDYQVDAA